MTKQKQIQKQITKNGINNKVEKLIEYFNKIQEQYIKKSRDILLQIVDLRRIQNTNYSYQDLENEKGLEEYKDKIKYFVKYVDLNTRTMTLENQGKISSADTMLIANLPKKLLRENQDKIVDKVISGEITRVELVEASSSNLYKKVGDDYKAMEEDSRELLEAIYSLTTITERIQKYNHIFKEKKNRDLLEERFNRLSITVKNILKKW
jgi:hypothetical protein